MKYNSIELKHIKKFNYLSFKFEDDNKIYCIAGQNGCGKSTLFSCLQLIQQAFIYNNDPAACDQYLSYLQNTYNDIITDPNSEIKFNYTIDNEKFYLLLKKDTISKVLFSLETNDKQNKLNLHWNLTNPNNLFILIPPYKFAHEEEYSFENVRLTNESTDLIADAIFNSNEIYQNAYTNIIENHIYERISPSKPSKNHVLQTSFHIFSKLFDGYKFERISANNPRKAFNIIAKPNSSSSCDIRKFSAGEKATLLTVYHLLKLQKFSYICFDEFENHFHEKLISKLFYEFEKMLSAKNILDYLKNRNISLPNASESYYNKIKINSLIFLTHSRHLLRTNKSIGSNYIINNNLINKIDSFTTGDFVKLDISNYNERILYVEGKSDVDFLRLIPELGHIQIIQLGNCDAVVKQYESVLSLKSDLADTKFIFLIDGDKFNNIDKVREKDKSFFQSSFVYNNNHEIENYLLNKETLVNWIKHELEHHEEAIPTDIDEQIANELDKIVDSLKEISVLKLALLNIQSNIEYKIKQQLNYKSLKDYQNHQNEIKQTLNKELNVSYLESTVDSSFSHLNNLWSENKIATVDGKAALAKLFNTLRPRYNLPLDTLTPYIRWCAKKHNSPLYRLKNSILDLSES